MTVGREADATIVIDDPHLSRLHARFTRLPGRRVLVEDLGSSNGTWVGDDRIGRLEVAANAEVRLGCSTTARLFELRHVTGEMVRVDSAIIAGTRMSELLATASRVAGARLPVVLLGETGTGKELVARFIHARGTRGERPMVALNCAAIPLSLVESTLFGHEKGAFTGAATHQKGVFEAAHGSTVFLDEIAELPLSAQAALLRVVESGRFSRVGATRETEVDVRVIAATHRDLERMCREGTFREDLFFRLSALTLTLPPLRERAEDIEPLATAFLRRAEQGANRTLSPSAIAWLRAYGWPGNVRELRNVIERTAILTCAPVIEEKDLPDVVRLSARSRDEDAPPSSSVRRGEPGGLRTQVAAHERHLLLATLVLVDWDRTEAAARLGIPVRTLSHRMKLLRIERPG